jgi:hypothetical protein
MAARFLPTGGVVNPYSDLQNAVAGVGQLYQNYDENKRREVLFKDQQDERDRVKSMRDFSTSYDSRVGDDYRGISANMRPLVEQQEAQARQNFVTTNPNATAEQASAFDTQLKNVRRSLANAEDVASSVASDYRKAGFSAAEADTYGRAEAANYGARGAAIAQAQAEADARNKAAEGMSGRLLDLYKVQSAADSAEIRGLLNGSNASGGSGFKALQDYLKGELDGIGSGDAKNAVTRFEQGMNLYNERARANGGAQLSFEQGQDVLLSNISRNNWDNQALFKDGPEFAALLESQFGAPAAKASDGKTSGTGNAALDRAAIIAGAQTQLSPAERAAILSPARVVVNPEQVVRSQIANAYSQLFPQAAQTNRALVENVSAPAPVGAVRRSVPAAEGNTSVTRPAGLTNGRYVPPVVDPLTGDATRGAGYQPLPNVAPAGVQSDAGTPTNTRPITPARELAEQIAAYERNGTDGSVDLPRTLQTLQARNPEMYQAVMRERNDISKDNLQYDKMTKEIATLESRSEAARKRLAAVDPNTLSTDRQVADNRAMFDLSGASRFGGVSTPVESDSPYQQYLNQQNQLDNWDQQIQQLRSRKQAIESTNQPKDFSRLKSILNR